MSNYLAAIAPGQAPSGYRYGGSDAPSPLASTGAGGPPTQTVGSGPQAYSPAWAANQTSNQFAQGQGSIQGVLAQLATHLQALTNSAAKPQGFTNLDEQKQEAAQINAGGTASAESALKEIFAALGQTGAPALGAGIGDVRAQGAQNLQSEYTKINTADQGMQQQNRAQALQLIDSLLQQIGSLTMGSAQMGQQQQFPVLGEKERNAATGGGTVTGNNGLGLAGADAQRWTQLAARDWQNPSQWTGQDRIDYMRLRDRLGY